MAFQVGYDKGATITPAGGMAATINITGWKNSDKCNVLDVTHTGTSGLTAFLAGIITEEGNIQFNLDSAQLPWAAAQKIKAGQKGVLTLVTGTTNPWSIPYIIEAVNHMSTVNGLVTVDFDYKLDVLSGSLSYPS